MKGAWLEELTWPEAKEWIESGHLIIIPVGAVSKEHGHHLPMNTDYLLAGALARGVAKTLPVLVAPILSTGYYPAFRHYPGSQHLSAATFQAVVEETLEGFILQGAKHIAIINTGVSTELPIKVAVREILERHGIRVPVADILGLGKRTAPLFKQKLGGHGDEHETSLILAIRPEAVRMNLAKKDYGSAEGLPETVFYSPAIFNSDPESGMDFSTTGVRGDPSLATPEKGKAALKDMIRDLVEGIRALYPEVV